MYGACSVESLPKKESHMTPTINVCYECFNEIGKGISHKYSGITAQNNAAVFIETLPQKQQDQIASNILKNKKSTKYKNKRYKSFYLVQKANLEE